MNECEVYIHTHTVRVTNIYNHLNQSLTGQFKCHEISRNVAMSFILKKKTESLFG